MRPPKPWGTDILSVGKPGVPPAGKDFSRRDAYCPHRLEARAPLIFRYFFIRLVSRSENILLAGEILMRHPNEFHCRLQVLFVAYH